jgi:hypothetical protein
MAKPTKRFWVGAPDGYGQPDDDDAEGLPIPDDDGNVYPRRRRPTTKTKPGRAADVEGEKRKRSK